MPIKHEDQDYYSPKEVSDIVADKMRKAGERRGLVEAERDQYAKRWEEAQPQLAAAEALTMRAKDLEAQLAQSQGSFQRYQAATAHGVTDPDTIDALVYAHGKLGDEAPAFADYLAKAAEDPTVLPTYLRNVLTPGEGDPPPPVEPKAGDPPPPKVVKGTKPPRKPPAGDRNEDFRARVAEADTFEKLIVLRDERRR